MVDHHTEYTLTLLTPSHDLTRFTCGNDALDAWLLNQALRAQYQDTARTYVWLDDNVVVAYYSVCPTSVRSDGLPRSVQGGNTVLPAYLLARLALDVKLQGQHLAKFLMADALETMDAAATNYGGRLIVVDAIDEALVPFYEKWGFRRIVGTNRLYLTARQLRASMPS